MARQYLFDDPKEEVRLREIVDALTSDKYICGITKYNPNSWNLSEDERNTVLSISTKFANAASDAVGAEKVSLEENLVNDKRPIFRDEKLHMIIYNDGTLLLPSADVLLTAEKQRYSAVLYDQAKADRFLAGLFRKDVYKRFITDKKSDAKPIADLEKGEKKLILVGVDTGASPGVDILTDLFIFNGKKFHWIGDAQRLSTIYENIRFEDQEEALLKALK